MTWASPNRNYWRLRLQPALMLILVSLLAGFLSCAREKDLEQASDWPQQEIMEETKPVTPPAPRITEEIYVDITARAALIFDKHKENLEEAHRQMDLVYQKYRITFEDYERYRRSLTPDDRRRLEKLVQERIQKIYTEYFENSD